MNLIITLVIGGIVGWLASIVMKTNAQMGIIANIVVGVVGSALGSWIAVQVNLAAGGFAGWIVSIIGAMVLIGILKVLGIFEVEGRKTSLRAWTCGTVLLALTTRVAVFRQKREAITTARCGGTAPAPSNQ